jgi:hypothetical protein
MRILLLLSLFVTTCSFGQNITFKNQSLLTLKYVKNDNNYLKPNIPLFYSIEDYKNLKFSGTVNADTLFATRTWSENNDLIQLERTITEKITVVFDLDSTPFGGKHISHAFYNRWVHVIHYYNINRAVVAFEDEWKELEVDIDYLKKKVHSYYTPVQMDSAMSLSFEGVIIENLYSLRDLCVLFSTNHHHDAGFIWDKKNVERIVHGDKVNKK